MKYSTVKSIDVHLCLLLSEYNFSFSIEYWFRILDLDGDGRISLLEMETFYNELVK